MNSLTLSAIELAKNAVFVGVLIAFGIGIFWWLYSLWKTLEADSRKEPTHHVTAQLTETGPVADFTSKLQKRNEDVRRPK